MLYFLKVYATAVVAFLAIDMVWLVFVGADSIARNSVSCSAISRTGGRRAFSTCSSLPVWSFLRSLQGYRMARSERHFCWAHSMAW